MIIFSKTRIAPTGRSPCRSCKVVRFPFPFGPTNGLEHLERAKRKRTRRNQSLRVTGRRLARYRSRSVVRFDFPGSECSRGNGSGASRGWFAFGFVGEQERRIKKKRKRNPPPARVWMRVRACAYVRVREYRKHVRYRSSSATRQQSAPIGRPVIYQSVRGTCVPLETFGGLSTPRAHAVPANVRRRLRNVHSEHNSYSNVRDVFVCTRSTARARVYVYRRRYRNSSFFVFFVFFSFAFVVAVRPLRFLLRSDRYLYNSIPYDTLSYIICVHTHTHIYFTMIMTSRGRLLVRATLPANAVVSRDASCCAARARHRDWSLSYSRRILSVWVDRCVTNVFSSLCVSVYPISSILPRRRGGGYVLTFNVIQLLT